MAEMEKMTAADYAKKAGKNLKRIMEEKDVTQSQLSHDLKISKATISSWVTGKRLPRAGAMDTLCRYLQCTKYDILDGPDVDAPQAVQEPLRDAGDSDLKYVLDALDESGYGHLKALVEAAAQADESCYDFVIGILKRNPKKK